MEYPLVSILIITYNSSEYLLETLESAKAQTYSNLELIVSDDSSSDNTVEICEKWMELNKNRFARTQLLTSKINTGISANANRGLKASKGLWLKPMGADDILINDCISSYIDFVSSTKSRFIFAIPSILVNPENDVLKTEMEDYYNRCCFFFNLTPRKQFNYLIINQIPVNPPTLFCSRSALMELNGFDQRYACEDLPLLLESTFRGHQLALLKKKTIHYRVHPAQASYKDENKVVNEKWYFEQLRIKKKFFTVKYVLCNPLLCFEYLVEIVSKFIIIKTGNRKDSSKIVNYLRAFKSYIPFSFISRIK